MTSIPLVWAFEVPEKNLPLVDEFIHGLKTDYADEFKAYQQQFSQKCYRAWLQTSSKGNFIVEYAEHENINPDEMFQNVQKDNSEIIKYSKEMKKCIHGESFENFKGIRKLIDVTCNIHENSNTTPLASVFAIKEGKVSDVVDWIDDVIRNKSDELTAYRNRMGVQRWCAWISEHENQQYLVQSHILNKGIQHFYDAYQKEDSDYSRLVYNMGVDCLGIDFKQKQDWPKSDLLIEVINPNLSEG